MVESQDAVVDDQVVAISTNFTHTCMACRVMFARADLHRDHFKSDWHRYNLKRKMAELPAVSAETFRLKVVEMMQQETAAASAPVAGQRCETCHKSYQSEAALRNHFQSKKHLELANSPVQPSENTLKKELVADVDNIVTESDDEDAETESILCGEALSVQTCLFCNVNSSTMDDNLTHMSLKHGFFVVDLEYCVDLEGLMAYLGQKVGEGFVCLWCNEKGRKFLSLDAVQKHTIDKCHCKMFHDGDAMLEYSKFYDYSSSYPDTDQANCEGDVDVNLPVLEENGFELVLPSGATIGHRSLLIYYKQNLKSGQQVSVIKKQTSSRLLSHYKAIGWTGTTGDAAKRKAIDMRFLKKIYSKQHMQLGVKANKLQKHFRSQIDF